MDPGKIDRPGARVGAWMNVDLGTHAFALVSSTVGGYVLESVVLVAAGAHHLAGLGFRMLMKQRCQEALVSNSRASGFALAQVLIWTCCVLLAMYVIAMGAHGVFHAEALASAALAAYAVPGLAAAATTAVLAGQSRRAGLKLARADAWLAATPSALALGVAFGAPAAQVGMFDAAAGLVAVLLLCTRSLFHLARAMD